MAHAAMTYAEYLDLERAEETRYQFLDGVVWAMSGGTPRHSKVKVNLAIAIGSALGDGPCQAYDSDLRIRVLETGLATYPDLAVVCGELALHPDDPHAVTNPRLLVGVLSPTTERWDRGEKFAHYRRIASLTDVLLVDPAALRIEHFHREADGRWWMDDHDVTGSVSVLGVTFAVSAAFQNLPPDTESPDA